MRFDLEGSEGKGTALEMHTIEFRGHVALKAKLYKKLQYSDMPVYNF